MFDGEPKRITASFLLAANSKRAVEWEMKRARAGGQRWRKWSCIYLITWS